MTNKTIQAIAKFSQLFNGVELSRYNPHFKNKYASWDDIWQAAKPAMDECKLSAFFTMNDGLITLNVCSEDGELITSTLPLNAPQSKNYAQALGSMITYFKRYLFAAMFNICEMEDDDGNAADAPKKVKITEHQESQIMSLKDKLNLSNENYVKGLKSNYKVSKTSELGVGQAADLIEKLNKKIKDAA